jgi:hypothetical protein
MLASALAGTPRLIVGKLNAALNSDDVHVGAGEKIRRQREVTILFQGRCRNVTEFLFNKTQFNFELTGGR